MKRKDYRYNPELMKKEPLMWRLVSVQTCNVRQAKGAARKVERWKKRCGLCEKGICLAPRHQAR